MAEARAYTNIAIVKYWGKHPKWEDLHVPTKSSLSFTVKGLYTVTKLRALPGKGKIKRFVLNEREYKPGSKEFQKVFTYLEKLGKYVSSDVLFYDYEIKTYNNFPTASGLASSASGFAALAKALLKELAKEHSWAEEILNRQERLSVVARLGSGSASRSVTTGIVLWRRGWDRENFDPLWDSHAEQIADPLENIKIIYVFVSKSEKKISSRKGMKISRDTSPFYWFWVEKEEGELKKDIDLVRRQEIEELFPRIMMHSNAFHAVCRSSFPPIEYLTNESINIIQRIHSFNTEYGNLSAYTFDAGPNPVLFVLDEVLDIFKKEVLNNVEFLVTEPV